MTQYNIPALTLSTLANILVSAILFGTIVTLIGITFFGIISATLHHFVTKDEFLNTVTLVSLSITVVMIGGFLLTYIGLILLVVAAGGVIWYLFSNKTRKKLTFFK